MKRKLYERFGVREYWMVDPHRKTVEIWEWTPGGLRRKAVLSATAGDSLATPLLAGLEIPLMEFSRTRSMGSVLSAEDGVCWA